MTDDFKAMEECKRERTRIYERVRDDLLKRALSNSENFDRAILTYSSAGLALSLTFLKDVVPLQDLFHPTLLYISWACFILAVIATVISYPVSQKAISKQLDNAEEYYLKLNETFFNAPNNAAKYIQHLSLFSGIMFICAILATASFITVNIERETAMKKIEHAELRNAAGIPKMQSFAHDAATVPVMQSAPPVPAKQPSSPTTATIPAMNPETVTTPPNK